MTNSILTLGVGLYTSREVLAQLGVRNLYIPNMASEFMSKIPVKYQEDIKKATDLLKSEGCSVFLFGSMVTGEINKNSDIDIGISGLPPKKFFRIYADLDKKTSNKIDLVDFDMQKDFYNLLNSLGEVVKVG
jgi:predicted nucleotidyltransferase